MDALPDIGRLKKRPEFLAAAKAFAQPRGGVLIQLRDRADNDPQIRAGFTASKKVGGSVERNRAKRRLREACRLLLPLHARPGCDYVFIARAGTIARPWGRLLDDVKTALISLAANSTASSGKDASAQVHQSVRIHEQQQ